MSTLDPRVVFYLERQRQIDEWYNLRKAATKAANQFFASLAEGISDLAARLDPSPHLWRSLDQSCPRLFLHFPSWVAVGHSEPRVGVGLEWSRSSALFDSSCLGLWVNPNKEIKQQEPLALRLTQTCEAVRQRCALKSAAWWPAWRYEKPSSREYWKDLDQFRGEILRDIEGFWQMLYPIVEQALAEHSSDPANK